MVTTSQLICCLARQLHQPHQEVRNTTVVAPQEVVMTGLTTKQLVEPLHQKFMEFFRFPDVVRLVKKEQMPIPLSKVMEPQVGVTVQEEMDSSMNVMSI